MDWFDQLRYRLAPFGLALLFVVSLYFTVTEARYRLFGEVTNATIIDVKQVPAGGRNLWRHQYRVTYRFTESRGATRTETDTIDGWWKQSGPTVAVRYIDGSTGSSRLDERSETRCVILFCCVCAGLSTWWWLRRRRGRRHAEEDELVNRLGVVPLAPARDHPYPSSSKSSSSSPK